MFHRNVSNFFGSCFYYYSYLQYYHNHCYYFVSPCGSIKILVASLRVAIRSHIFENLKVLIDNILVSTKDGWAVICPLVHILFNLPGTNLTWTILPHVTCSCICVIVSLSLYVTFFEKPVLYQICLIYFYFFVVFWYFNLRLICYFSWICYYELVLIVMLYLHVLNTTEMPGPSLIASHSKTKWDGHHPSR